MTTLILVVGAGLAISFVCSVLEAVLLSVTHSHIALMKENGERAGELLGRMREEIDEPIAAILTLNTIAHTVGAAMGGAIALEVFGSKWIALFSGVLTLAILVFSEILPKTLGATYWKRLAGPAAHTLRWMTLVMRPILKPLGLLNRLMAPRGAREPKVTRAELEILAELGRREGTIDQEEWQVMTNVMNLGDVRVGDVMTPRTRVVAVHADTTLRDVVELIAEEAHTRMPVHGGSLDDIRGQIHALDVWSRVRTAPDATAAEVMRAMTYVPESKRVEELIREMRRDRYNMAAVIDEFGGTAGIVTLEDLIEEIVGEIHDEHDDEMPLIEAADGGYRISGLASIDVVNERLHLELEDPEHETLGGYMVGKLGRLAREGDAVSLPEGELRVLKMSGRRVERLLFTRAGGPGRTPA